MELADISKLCTAILFTAELVIRSFGLLLSYWDGERNNYLLNPGRAIS